jgi:two-component system, LuxR family, sensor kinase FixL
MQLLEESAVTTSELFKVSCRFECDSPTLVHTAATSGHWYRIAQEAITNAVKHGKANNIGFSLETLDDGIPLQVQDDGVGFPDALPRNAGMGLRIKHHRASMFGAAFKARRKDSGGTVVSFVVRHNHNSEKISREQTQSKHCFSR